MLGFAQGAFHVAVASSVTDLNLLYFPVYSIILAVYHTNLKEILR